MTFIGRILTRGDASRLQTLLVKAMNKHNEQKKEKFTLLNTQAEILVQKKEQIYIVKHTDYTHMA